MNKTPCKNCVHFDPQHKFVNGKRRLTQHGYCSVQSTYAYVDQPGQVVPPGVDRVGPGELARLMPVMANGVVADCLRVLKKA